MKVVTTYPDSVFCWVDLTTTDAEGAKAFYTALFGWNSDDRPTDMGGVYSMLQIEGKNVAGLSAMPPDMQAQGAPPFWASYVKHSDIDAVAAKITEAGGTLLFPPMDVMEEGRMAMAQDPTGAMFGIWQPRGHIGAELVNQPNTLSWNELQTRDVNEVKTFYQAVFDWTYTADESGYVMCLQNGRRQAGMLQMDESWGDIPANWAVYFLVEDVDKMAAQAQALGGTLLVPPSKAGEIARFSVVQDPQGGVFSIIQFNGPIDPPPGF